MSRFLAHSHAIGTVGPADYMGTMRGGARIQPGDICHIIPRFVGQEWFIASGAERSEYLIALGLAIARTDWKCFCFAIMSNHIHLGLVAGTMRLREWMRPMHTNFAQWINRRRERIGAVFVRGPNVIDVQTDGTARLINYVHRNPVRAGVVNHPGESDWTSYRAYAGTVRRRSWLDVECGLELARCGASSFREWEDGTVISREELELFQVQRRVEPGRPRALSGRTGSGRAEKAKPA